MSELDDLKERLAELEAAHGALLAFASAHILAATRANPSLLAPTLSGLEWEEKLARSAEQSRKADFIREWFDYLELNVTRSV